MVSMAVRWIGPLPDMPVCVPNYPGYSVTADGTVIGPRGAPLKPDVDTRGRRRVSLCRGGIVTRKLVSRLMLEVHVGPCPDGTEACHDDGDCSNNRLDNLRWDSHSANLLDRRRHGTNVQGVRVHTAKLTDDDVREIRRIGYPLRPLAERYGVSPTLISHILRRKVWQHV